MFLFFHHPAFKPSMTVTVFGRLHQEDVFIVRGSAERDETDALRHGKRD
jgi:hypothetical protein